MMISRADECFVWIWLPDAESPVVAGRITDTGASPQLFSFTYGRSYLGRSDAIPLSPFELPLQLGEQLPVGMLQLHACLRDAGPDSWGRRALETRYDQLGLSELEYLLFSSSDRIGALDFQSDSQHYESRALERAFLGDLLRAAEIVEQRSPLPPDLEIALMHGTSVGGARPKALIKDGDDLYIAKFSASTDTYDIVKSEFVAMRLAALAGLNAARVRLKSSLGRDVLLVERFDRKVNANAFCRRHILSGLSLLGLDEMEGRYASYLDLADLIRQRFIQPRESLHEFYKRLAFNVLIGNTDDHARNHAAFWDGQALVLTPAYDICPQQRTGRETNQAMRIEGSMGDLSTLVNVLSVCERFQLGEDEAQKIIRGLEEVIRENWESVCDEAHLASAERQRLWGSAILNPFCFQEIV
jgi:serine/threonine-protein kinase HipA